MNLTSIHEDVGSIPGPLSGLMNTAMSCGVGHRGGLDVVLLWLWLVEGGTLGSWGRTRAPQATLGR